MTGAAPLKLVVTGGGAAGWLAALIFQAEAKRQGRPLSLTLVESSRIPTIGMGERTISVFRGVLQSLGIDEREVFASTDATIKYGIRHRDWRRLGRAYDGPIDDVYHLTDRVPNAGLWTNTFCVAAGRSVAEPDVFAALMAGGKAPVAEVEGREVPVNAFHHGFHFDQAKVGVWLLSKAQGIETIDGLVEGVEHDPDTGDITALRLDNGRTVVGDFFVDATGFRRMLIGAEMGASWVRFADILPVNRAMPFWLDLKPGEELPPHAEAWTQKTGWMWQIPTSAKISTGPGCSTVTRPAPRWPVTRGSRLLPATPSTFWPSGRRMWRTGRWATVPTSSISARRRPKNDPTRFCRTPAPALQPAQTRLGAGLAAPQQAAVARAARDGAGAVQTAA